MTLFELASSAIASSVLTVLLGWLAANALKPAFDRWIQSRFDRSLEGVKSDLRREEDRLKAQHQQLDTLNKAILTGVSERNGALEARRLVAIERLWTATIELNHLMTIAHLSKSLNVDAIIDAAEKRDAEGEKAREFVRTITEPFKLGEYKPSTGSVDTDRIFVPPLIWAHFSTLRSILVLIAVRLQVAREGVGRKFLKSPDDLFGAIKSALPYLSDYVDKFGVSSLPYVAEILQEKVREGIISHMEDDSSDRRTADRASRILAYTKNIETQQSAIDSKIGQPPAPGLLASSIATPPEPPATSSDLKP